jgi:carbonic anhydrase
LAGNRQFVAGRAKHLRQTPQTVRDLAAAQDPFAIVLGCADSRVSPELVFDQGLGDLIESGGTAPGHIGAIVEALRPIMEPVLHSTGDRIENGVVANIRAQSAALVSRSEIVREQVEAGAMVVVGGRYDLDTGRVTRIC